MRHHKWQRVALGLVMVASLSIAARCAGTASEVTLTPRQEPIPPSYFSMNILFHPKNRVPWPTVALGGWRTSHVNWADLQPERNRWYFDLLDKYVDWSVAHHLDILMPLTYTPRWASSTPDAPTDVEQGNPPGLSGPPRDMNDWRVFVSTIATRYKGRIHNWEIWNEPNRGKSWTGDVDTMVEMTREAHEILKKIDPTCVVVSPAATERSGLPFLNAFLTRGGGKYADVIGYHFYVGDEYPEVMVSLIQQVQTMMQRAGVGDKPLWDTEAGWLKPPPLPPAVAAAYVARAYILNWAAGVSRLYWFAWEAHGLKINLTQADNASLTPAGTAFAEIQRWLTGAVMGQCASSPDGLWVCELRQKGMTTHIVWAVEGNQAFSVPGSWHARSFSNLAGNDEPFERSSVEIGVEPMLIH